MATLEGGREGGGGGGEVISVGGIKRERERGGDGANVRRQEMFVIMTH